MTLMFLVSVSTAVSVTESGWQIRRGKVELQQYLSAICFRSEITACGVPQKSVIQGVNSETGAQWQFQGSRTES